MRIIGRYRNESVHYRVIHTCRHSRQLNEEFCLGRSRPVGSEKIRVPTNMHNKML